MMKRITDWVGFFFFAGVALYNFAVLPVIGVFLLPTLAYEAFAATSFLIRDRARASVRTLPARAVAYACTALPIVYFPVVKRFRPEWLLPTTSDSARLAGTAVWLAGAALVATSVWYLRRSFSIEPAARRLITAGPYRIARHPIYLGYLVQYAAIWLLYPTAAFALAIGCWLMIALPRMRFEEQVLSATFPLDYAEYRRRVGALWPNPMPPAAPSLPATAGRSAAAGSV